MKKRLLWLVVVPALLLGRAAVAQTPILDEVSSKFIQKYQSSSCEELWRKKGQPKSPREQQAIQMMHEDPQIRAAFIDLVAAPVANKMFECGMIP